MDSIITASNTYLTVKPKAGFATNKTYTLTIPPNSVIDGAGNTLNYPYTLTFKTSECIHNDKHIRISL
ncbi:MAG: Ig-like domain-containing protein [Rubrobacteridae bacterium]|nr:Ig-like domain-containing protein [Rubrobacteridae bacterium]